MSYDKQSHDIKIYIHCYIKLNFKLHSDFMTIEAALIQIFIFKSEKKKTNWKEGADINHQSYLHQRNCIFYGCLLI